MISAATDRFMRIDEVISVTGTGKEHHLHANARGHVSTTGSAWTKFSRLVAIGYFGMDDVCRNQQLVTVEGRGVIVRLCLCLVIARLIQYSGRLAARTAQDSR